MKIVINMAECSACRQVLISTHVHDFRTCQCGKTAVDGGREYLKRMGSEWTELSVHEINGIFCRVEGA